MKNEIFIGVEAEGRLKGVPTMFSQTVAETAFEKAIQVGLRHVFFGAKGGRLLPKDYDNLIRILKSCLYSEIQITLHVPLEDLDKIPAQLLSRCHILAYKRVESAAMLSCDIEVKLENDTHAAIYGRPDMIKLEYIYDKQI